MNSIKRTENLMALSARQMNPDYNRAFNNMLIAIGFLDQHDKFCRLKLIDVLYNVNKRRKTYERIARDFHISDNALRRHRIYFTECFAYFLKISGKEFRLAA